MRKEIIGVLALSVLFIIVTLTGPVQKGVYSDELAHIPAGYSYWETGDFRLNPEHPPLVKLLAGIPLLALQPTLPLEHQSWNASAQWEFGKKFLFESGQDADRILFFSRIPMVLVGLLGGIFVYLWAKELYGKKAGLFAMFLFVFEPTILAHTGIVQTDIGLMTFTFITAYFFWKFLGTNKTQHAILTGIFFGLTLATKYSGLHLFGMLPVLLAIKFFKEKKADAKQIFWLLGIFAIGIVVLTATYGFSEFPKYIEGFQKVRGEFLQEGRVSYLMGDYSEQGWWYYFIFAMIIKTPIAVLALFSMTIFFKIRKKELSTAELFLLVAFAFVHIAMMTNKVNIGVRHVLTAYPFMFVFASSIINEKKLRHIICALSLWLIVASLWIYPDYLAYFNEFVGGPSNGYKYLIDSNIDWGQDLKGLKQWTEEHKTKEIYLSYFGNDDPKYRGVAYKKPKCYPTKGITAASANVVAGFTEVQSACSKWMRELEPIDNIGHSILIYEVKDEGNKEENKQEFCDEACTVFCRQKGMQFESSEVEKKCKCYCK